MNKRTFVMMNAPMRIEWLLPSQLYIDKELLVNPRMPEERIPHLRKIADEFNWNHFRVPVVAYRGHDENHVEKFAILDGGGSWYILMYLKTELNQMRIPCHVVENKNATPLSKAEEARVFLSQRHRKRLTGTHYFIDELIEKKPEALAIQGIAKKIGLEIPDIKYKHKLAAWPAGYSNLPVMRALFREGDLQRTLLLCRNIWSTALPHPTAITAIGIILKAYPNLDEERLRKVMAAHDPNTLLNEFKVTRGRTHLYNKAVSLSHAYIDLYDKSFQGKLLGGTRKNGTYKQYPRRVELEDAATALIQTWKLTSKPAIEAKVKAVKEAKKNKRVPDLFAGLRA